MRALITIPARIGSTRFPQKPLHLIAGRSLLQRVVQIAKTAARADDVAFVVAVDDDKVAAHCKEIGAPWVMTDPDLPSGSDRALAAAHVYCEKTGTALPDFVLNLQGDAPFTPPEHVEVLIEAARNTAGADVFTPVIQLDWAALDALRDHKQAHPYSGTTCVRNGAGEALWFSKQILPAIRGENDLRAGSDLSPVLRHIGLYGYRFAALQRFTELGKGHYESLEGLEQLRFLENGMRIHAALVASPQLSMSGVDTPADAQLAEELIARHGDPYDVLEARL